MRRELLAILSLLVSAAACAPAPRGRPVELGPTDTGPGSLEATRRQLEGTWELVSLETYPEPGKAVRAKAAGRLTYDAYGNVNLTGVIDEPGSAPTDALNYSGVIVIDVQKKEWRLTSLAGQPGSSALPADVGPDKVRKYEFAGDLLKTSTIDSTGRVTATATWKKTG